MCARKVNMRARFNPDDLLNQATRDLPRARDLRPYPILCTRRFYGHSGKVTTIDIEISNGSARFASGTTTGEVFIWQTWNERCVAKTQWIDDPIECIVWNPKMNGVLAVATQQSSKIHLCFNTNCRPSQKLISELKIEGSGWNKLNCTPQPKVLSTFATIDSHSHIRSLTWHPKGDYLAAVSSEKGVVVNQISRCRSHIPYFINKKTMGDAHPFLAFHPNKPFLILSHNSSISLFDVTNQSVVRKLQTGTQWPLLCLSVHPSDGLVHWFDLDYGDKPFRSLTYHQNRASGKIRRNVASIVSTSNHWQLPLMASASADGTVIVAHANVFDDFTKNPLIVPVKRLWASQAQNWSQKLLRSAKDKSNGINEQKKPSNRRVVCCFDRLHPWIVTSNGPVLSLFTELSK
ncbi:hypothetical protein ACOME3_001342 [Neoechinorhynchus agilis]